MGILAKQTLRNTLIIFSGAFFGALNILLLFPIVMPDEEIGLTRLLITFTVLISQVASFGGPLMLVKYVPKFNSGKGNYQGSATFIFTIGIIGFICSIFFLLFGKPIFEFYYSENSNLFISYFFYLIPLVLFQIVINLFSGLLQAVYRSVFPLLLNEVILRILQTVILVVYFFDVMDFSTFMLLFVGIYGFTALFHFSYLLYHKEIRFNSFTDLKKIDKVNMIKYGLANMLSGLAGTLTNRIDLMMIGAMVGSAVLVAGDLEFDQGLIYITIYTIAAYMATLIEMPARALGNIASTFVSKAWNDNDIHTIDMIYKRSAINQLLVGVLIFVVIWISIDNLLMITGKDYSVGKWVFFFLGIAKLFHVASGMNGKIIVLSKYYIVGTYLNFGLAIFTFLSNLILIPIFSEIPGRSGIEGAALATAISIFLYNIIGVLFLWKKYKLQPYNLKTLWIIVIGAICLIFVLQIPDLENVYLDISLKSLIVIALFIPLVFSLKISEDFNRISIKIVSKTGIKI